MTNSTQTTVVTACDNRYFWGVFMLVSSLRLNGVRSRINVVGRQFGQDQKRAIMQFEGVSYIESPASTIFAQADKPEALRTGFGTDYVTWIDADCIAQGDISDLLLPAVPDTLMIRFRSRQENRLRFGNRNQLGDIPEDVRAQWCEDVAERVDSRIETTVVTNAFTLPSRCATFVARWETQICKLVEKYRAAWPLAYRHSSGRGLSDELVLNSLLAFAEDVPVTSTFQLDKRKDAFLVHLSLTPKPWERWTVRTLKHYDRVLALLEQCRREGIAIPGLPPWPLRRHWRWLARTDARFRNIAERLGRKVLPR
jgi:hypothetical protein